MHSHPAARVSQSAYYGGDSLRPESVAAITLLDFDALNQKDVQLRYATLQGFDFNGPVGVSIVHQDADYFLRISVERIRSLPTYLGPHS